MECPGSLNRWEVPYNPPIGRTNHLYTTYILPIGWLYITYHLSREPETAIDIWGTAQPDGPPNPPRTNSVRWSCPPRSRRRYEWPPVEVTTTECHFLGEGIFWDLGKDEYTSGRLTVRTWKWLFGRLFSFSIGCIVRFHVNLPGWKSFVIIGNRELRIAKNIYTKYECIYKNLGTCMYV